MKNAHDFDCSRVLNVEDHVIWESLHATEAQIGNVRPGGGNYTVREIFTLLRDGFTEWMAMAEKLGVECEAVPHEKLQPIVASMPMVGEQMYASKKKGPNMCTSYCEVSDECFACNGGI